MSATRLSQKLTMVKRRLRVGKGGKRRATSGAIVGIEKPEDYYVHITIIIRLSPALNYGEGHRRVTEVVHHLVCVRWHRLVDELARLVIKLGQAVQELHDDQAR